MLPDSLPSAEVPSVHDQLSDAHIARFGVADERPVGDDEARALMAELEADAESAAYMTERERNALARQMDAQQKPVNGAPQKFDCAAGIRVDEQGVSWLWVESPRTHNRLNVNGGWFKELT